MAEKTKVKFTKKAGAESVLASSIIIWEAKNLYGSFPHKEEDFGSYAFVVDAIEVNGKIFIDAEAIFGKPRI